LQEQPETVEKLAVNSKSQKEEFKEDRRLEFTTFSVFNLI